MHDQPHVEQDGPETPRVGDLDVDPALAAAVLEIEQHVAAEGWDRPARLFALVDTKQLVEREPALAAAMGRDDAAAQGSLTPVEQDGLSASVPLERALETISWPADVTGWAAAYAAAHPARQELRMVAGATRAGATYCAMRFRSHDDDTKVVGGADLVPALLELLTATLTDEHGDGHEENDRT